MKAFEMIIEDGERVFKCVRPAKDINQVKQIYGGNGDFVRIKDVTFFSAFCNFFNSFLLN